MANTSKSVNLSNMTAAERLAFYREAAKAAKPAAQPGNGMAPSEVVGKIAADTRGFFTNVAAAYKFHRSLNS